MGALYSQEDRDEAQGKNWGDSTTRQRMAGTIPTGKEYPAHKRLDCLLQASQMQGKIKEA